MGNEYMMDPAGAGPFHPISAMIPDHILDLLPNNDRRRFLMVGFNPPALSEGRIVRTGGYSNTGVSMADMYLMAAESHVRTGNTDKALEYLNELRRHRITPDGFVELESSNANEVLLWILEDRIREFVATGYRWYDMRRLWDDPVGSTLIRKERVLDGTTYTLTRERLTVRIPEYIMQFNRHWVQNP
jgi:pentatricopeptide repeat protein